MMVRIPTRLLWFAAILLVVILPATPASAHKVFVFATVQGGEIRGEVYFHGGDPVADASVSVLGPANRSLGECSTDSQGRFAFLPRYRCDHKLVADVGMGHTAEYTVPAEELPDGLPRAAAEDLGPGDADPAGRAAAAAHGHDHADEHAHEEEDLGQGQSHVHPHEDASPHDHAGTAGAEELGRQIAALRKDLDRWKSQLRMQDILGGIGYILGLGGLAFYFLGTRQRDRRTAAGK